MTEDSHTPRMLVRPVHADVCLVRNATAVARIVTPTADPWRAAAQRLADAVSKLTGAALPVIDVESVLGGEGPSLTADAKAQPLVFVGHIGVNLALLEPHMRRLLVVDEASPGCATVQTYGNPWGNGSGIAVAGASSADDIDSAVDMFIEYCRIHARGDSLALPRICNPGPDHLVETAEKNWRRVARPSLEPWYPNLREADKIHLGYEQGRQLHEFTTITDLGLFDDGQVNDIEQEMLDVALQIPEKVWWYGGPRCRNGRVGGRHENFKNPRLYLLIQHLLNVGRPNEAAQHRLTAMRDEVERYLEYIVTCAHRNDHDGSESTMGWEAIVWYALTVGQWKYFISLRAKDAAFHAFLETDNHGASATHCHYGGVEDLFQTSQIRQIIRAAAWWYKDGRYKWLLEHMPYTHRTQYGFPLRMPIDDIPSCEPREWLGVQWLALSEYSYETSPAAADWRQPDVRRDRTFDVLTFRSGFGVNDQYLAIDGFQNHFQPLGLGSVLRYVDLGKLFLVAHTGAEGNYFKSGLAVSHGTLDADTSSTDALPGRVNGSTGNPNDREDPGEPWGAAMLTSLDSDAVGLAAMQCPDYHDTDWTRHIVWKKDGYFVFIDQVVARKPGQYMLTATWRTGEPATLHDGTWVQQQDDVTFFLKPAQSLACRAGQEPAHLYQNEVVPFVMRQSKPFNARSTGDQAMIANLVYASSPEVSRSYDIALLSHGAFVVRGPEDYALMGVGGYGGEGLTVRAAMFHISTDRAVLADAAELSLGDCDLLRDTSTNEVNIEWQADDRLTIRRVLERLWSEAAARQTALTADGPPSVKVQPKWRRNAFDRHRRQIVPVRASAASNTDGSASKRWRADLGCSQDVDEVIVVCKAERLTGGERWPGIGSQPAWFEPVTLTETEAATARLTIRDKADGEKSSVAATGKLNQRLVGPFGKSFFAQERFISLQGGRGRYVDLHIPDDLPLKEVEILGTEMLPAQIIDLRVCDLDPTDGEKEMLCRTADHQLALIDDRGRVLWRRTFENKLLAAAALDIEMNGHKQIVASDGAANLWRIARDGQVLEQTKLTTDDNAKGDFFSEGQIQNRPYSLGLWRVSDEERPALFMGTYQSVAWRLADGRIICFPESSREQASRTGFCWRGLVYWEQVLDVGADLNGDGVDDQVFLGRGYATPPSLIFFSGRTREPFAEHAFPNGFTLGLERARLNGRDVILAANEFQLATYTLDGRAQWAVRFDTPAADYALSGDQIYVAKRDGLLLCIDADGNTRGQALLDAQLHSVAASESVVVAGDGGLYVLDQKLGDVRRIEMPSTHVAAAHENNFAVAMACGDIVILPMT